MKNRSLAAAMKATLVLLIISAVCVAVLCLCNMFFPKYVPVLDAATAKLINGICETGRSDKDAFDGGYIVLLREDEYGVTLSDYNKSNKSRKAEVLAVYAQPKGVNAGAYIIESQATGRDGNIIILTAYRDGAIVGATVKKQGESYFSKLPADLFQSNVVGRPATDDINLPAELEKTGATLSLTAVNNALGISNVFVRSYGDKLREVINELSKEALETND